MPSFEALAEAAESLGMTASREGTSLRVALLKGMGLTISDEAGRRMKSVDVGGLPAWAPHACVGLLGAVVAVTFVRHAQLDRSTYVAFLVFFSAYVVAWLTTDWMERAQERLNNRAYLLEKAEQETAGDEMPRQPDVEVGMGEQRVERRAEVALPSLETLERAANSIDMETSREGTSLKVFLFDRSTLTFSQKDGELLCKARSGFAWMPEWFWNLVWALCLLYLVLLGLGTTGPAMMLNVFFLSLLVLSKVTSMLKAGRAKERLFDRAYDMETSGTEIKA